MGSGLVRVRRRFGAPQREILSAKCQIAADAESPGGVELRLPRAGESRKRLPTVAFCLFSLSTGRLTRHEEMGDRVKAGPAPAGHERGKAGRSMTVRESLTARKGSKRLNLKRTGKIKRTRRLTSRKLRLDPPDGAPLTDADRCRWLRMALRAARKRPKFLAADARFSLRTRARASAEPVPDRGNGRSLRFRYVRPEQPPREAFPRQRCDRFPWASGRDRSRSRQCFP